MILERLIVSVGADLTGLRNITAGARNMEGDVGRSLDAVRTKTSGFGRALSGLHGQLTKSRSAMALFAGAAGTALATRAVFELGAAVGETASKFSTVFGPETKRVSGFIERFGVTAGLSNREAQELLATTAAIGQGMGLTGRAAAAFSIDVTRLAGDLSSFNNIPIEETSRAIQAAITGEREQLKRYGIVISEADVQRRALAQTGKTTAAQLTQEEKAYATLAIVTDRAGVAVGDLARTKDSAANQARALRAEVENLKESMAVSLLPAMGAGVEGLNAFIKGLQIMGAESAVAVARMELGFAKINEGLGGPLARITGLGEGAGLFDPLGLDLFSRAVGADLTMTVDAAEANLERIRVAAEAVKFDVVGLTDGLEGLADGFDRSGAAAAAAAGAIGRRLGPANLPAPSLGLLSQKGTFLERDRDFIGTKQVTKYGRDPKTGLRGLKRITEGGIPINMPEGLTALTRAPSAVDPFRGDTGVESSLLGDVGEKLKSMGSGLGNLLTSLNPMNLLFDAISRALGDFMISMTPIIEVLAKALLPILKALFPVFKLLVVAATYLGQIIFTISGGIAKAIGWLIRAIGKAIDALPFVSGKSIIKAGEAMMDLGKGFLESSTELGKARDEIKAMEWQEAADGVSKLGDAASEATAALRNVPAGFKVALERFRASDPVVFAPAGGGAAAGAGASRSPGGDPGGGGGVHIDTLNMYGVQDPKGFVDELENEVEWRARTGGSRISTTTRRL